MRLVIFSPLAASSAIGRVTRLVVDALADQGHHVAIVRSEEAAHLKGAHHPVRATIAHWERTGDVRNLLREADAVVYQVGNDYGFHRGCLEWLPHAPGIVCLHDFFLGNLFLRWADRNREAAEYVLGAWYGADVADRYFGFQDPTTFIEDTVRTAPMTEWVCSMAHGVITHSNWGVPRVLRSCPGPVRVAALPYDAVAHQGVTEADRSPGAIVVLTVGHVNANKRVESVIRAIGESPRLRRTTTYKLLGRIEPQMQSQLEALARDLGVTLVVRGEVEDQELRGAMTSADVVCSLRMPPLEAASASTVEAMLYGKAVLVMDIGFYSDLPNDTIRKVSPDREISDIRRHLEALANDDAERNAIGRRAADWASRTFRADAYARSLTQVADQVALKGPAMDAIRFFADILADWGATSLPTSDLTTPLRIFEQ